MGKSLPLNRILIIIFFAVFVSTSVLLFFLFSKNGYNNLTPVSTPIVTQKGKSTETDFSPDIKKIQTPDANIVFYYLNVILDGQPSFDPATGNARGKFYFVSDKNKTLYKYTLSQIKDKFYIGVFSQDFQGAAFWNYLPKSDLLARAQNGVNASLVGIFYTSVPTHVKMISETDNFIKTLSDKNFSFQAAQIGFIAK